MTGLLQFKFKKKDRIAPNTELISKLEAAKQNREKITWIFKMESLLKHFRYYKAISFIPL